MRAGYTHNKPIRISSKQGFVNFTLKSSALQAGIVFSLPSAGLRFVPVTFTYVTNI